VVVVGGLGKQKKLRSCGKKGQKPKVVWAYANGGAKVLSVTDAGAATKKCIEREMKKVKAGEVSGKCEALFIMGK
jgi:hypothetical protein